MKKQFAIKIIPRAIIFAMFLLQIISPLQTSAATIEEYGGYIRPTVNSSTLNWNNPNKKGDNPYQLKTTNIVNSDLIMNVVGCTGIVNKVSKAILSLVQTKAKIPDIIYTPMVPIQIDSEALLKLQQANDQKASDAYREECLNGIAYTLAKNQLTSMTKYTMNWIATGFSGDPMYVRNANSFMASITNDLLVTEVNFFKKTNINMYPYGVDYAHSQVGAFQSKNNFYNSMKQTLTNFLPAGKTVNDFSSDFSIGGWDGWLALTQQDQNNPLGFNMIASQHLADEQAKAVTTQNEELIQNNGYLSQKKCVEWKRLINTYNAVDTVEGSNPNDYEDIPTAERTANNCSKWETVTPGSTIKDKISTYINAPERQLELADSINESLNSLFTSLISQFQNQGLTSLSSNLTDFKDINLGGFGSNSLNNVDLFGDQTSNGYTNGSFDLIRDLGNTYVKEKPINKGGWNASTNNPVLTSVGPAKIIETPGGNAPIDESGNTISTSTNNTNIYYTVTVTGNTKLFDGNIGWAKGERAYFDGTKWQKWVDTTKNPIEKRGVIQIQQDYIVAAKEALSSLPSVMPAIGELDYCIPGPNPNWRLNSEAAREAYYNYLDGITVQPKPKATGIFASLNDFLAKYLRVVSMGILDPSSWFPTQSAIVAPEKSGTLYNTYKDIFKGSNISNKLLVTDLDETKDTELWWYVKRNPLFYVNNGDSPSLLEMISTTDAEARRVRLQNKIDNIRILVQNMDNEYDKKIRAIYGDASSMQQPSVNHENTVISTPNKTYLPMGQTGLNITQKILSYDETVTTSTNDYKNSIVQANSNIYKLNAIKTRVNEIIGLAQARRAKLLGPDIPQACLDQEDIQYIDSTDLVGGSSEAGRCFDDLDNDLDGKIDAADHPDCDGVTTRCSISEIYTVVQERRKLPSEKVCSDIISSVECNTSTEYNIGREYKCKWNN